MADLLPDARVIILHNSNLANATIEEITEFDSASSTLSTTGMGRCVITIPNPQDKFSSRTTRIRDTIEYVKEVTKMNLVKEMNDELQDLSRRLRAGDGNAEQNFRTQELILQTLGEKTRIETMSRIFVDYRGRDERYYAGFTGMISGVEDSMTVGADVALTLQCLDLTRYLQLTPIVIQAGINPPHESDPERGQRLTGAAQDGREGVLSTIYSGQDNSTILRDVITKVNSFITQEGFDELLFRLKDTEEGKRLVDDDRSFFLFHKLWKTQFDGQSDYNGSFPVVVPPSQNPVADPVVPSPLPGSNERDFARAKREGNLIPTYLLSSHFLIHRDIDRTGTVYKKMFRTAFDLYQNSTQPALQIIQHVARITWGEFFSDGMGNLIYQPQLVDYVPGLTAPDDPSFGRVREIGTIDNDLVRGIANVDVDEDDQMDFHGNRYILGDRGLRSWRFKDDESGFYTQALATPGINFLPDGIGDLAPSKLLGFSKVSQADERKFGVRHLEIPQLILGSFLKDSKPILTAFAKAALKRVNAKVRSGTVVYNMRPDIQMGRTVYAIERETLFYVVSSTNNFSKSQRVMNTTLGLSYGHSPHEPIGDPWLEAAEVLKELQAATRKVSTTTSKATSLPVTTPIPESPFVPPDLVPVTEGSAPISIIP